MDNPTRRSLLLSTALTAAGIFIFAITFEVILEDGYWARHTSDSGCTRFCESNNNLEEGYCPPVEERATVHQPMNSYSNFAFFFVGLLPITRRGIGLDTVSWLAACSFLTMGSFFFHAITTSLTHTLDVGGMYAMEFHILAAGIHSVTGLGWIWLVIPIWALFITFFFKKRQFLQSLFGVENLVVISFFVTAFFMIILIMTKMYRVCKRKKENDSFRKKSKAVMPMLWQAITPGIMGIFGVVLQRMDLNGTWCNPDSIIQGHAIFHILGAFVCYLVWRFFERYTLAGIRSTNEDEASEEGLGSDEVVKNDTFPDSVTFVREEGSSDEMNKPETVYDTA